MLSLVRISHAYWQIEAHADAVNIIHAVLSQYTCCAVSIYMLRPKAWWRQTILA
jgi:hypothetical protein